MEPIGPQEAASSERSEEAARASLLGTRLHAIRDALRAGRQGDFSVRVRVTPEESGLLADIAVEVNELLELNRSLLGELDRVAKVVIQRGEVGERVSLGPVSGGWRVALDSVNALVAMLSRTLDSTTETLARVARGDLGPPVRPLADGVPARGSFLKLQRVMDAAVGRLGKVSAAVSQVLRAVGEDGSLGAMADERGLSGVWRRLVEDANHLSTGFAEELRGIVVVSEAIARGDLSQKITADAHGQVHELKRAINATVDQLRAFASEVNRVAREVGVEGKLGAQAEVPDALGVWRELTEAVNGLAGNLTAQVRNISQIATAIARGDLSQKISVEARGEILDLKNTLNATVDRLRAFASEVTRVAREVGSEGRLGGQADVQGVSGTWRDLTDSVNRLAGKLTTQVRDIAQVATAIAAGDLSQKITVEAQGEILELKTTVNAMLDRLRTFAAEVTRVAREVGTEGRLGGQAEVPGVGGTWQELTENVNLMARNLTDQVRGIARVVTAVANGDLEQKLVLEARGEIAQLAETINAMTATLRTFAAEVSSVAREVGIEGRLGGQARVPGASGTWRDLTDNVNWLAANLTTQVRAIAEVAKAVTEGDLTRSIAVGARGEVLSLKDTINQMIANLRDTVVKTQDQDWLKSNLARFFALMQGQRDLQSLADSLLRELTPTLGAQSAAFYLADGADPPSLSLTSTWAHVRRHALANHFGPGEGLVGQCALERKPIVVNELPDDYVPIASGLGSAAPRAVAVLPILFEDKVRAVLELASFHEFSQVQLTFLEQLLLNVGLSINLIGTSMRTEELLQQLRGSNLELERRRRELEEKARQLEDRNREIAEAAVLEAKAEELAKVSQYKTQFLTNMSHEIRTPLNSMMILAQMLSTDEEARLSSQQKEWAGTIVSSGRDLLSLINQILDLSKVEAGRVEAQLRAVELREVCDFVEQTFRPVATQKGLTFEVGSSERVPRVVITDEQLLEQILKNLVSNALKFTEKGKVSLRVELASSHDGRAELDFVVRDTGPGIAQEKQLQIFEPFQQADATITRKFGGTGLGLAISRQYARLLGGELRLESRVGEGSVFTLHLPVSLEAAPPTPAPARAANVSEMARLSGHELLLVEDDPRNLYATTAFFERSKVKVLTATSAEQAYAQLAEHPGVVAVVMDIMMPQVDGLEATREIRKNPRFSRLPIIAYSANASASDRAECLKAGCSDFVSKPADPNELFAAIVRQLE